MSTMARRTNQVLVGGQAQISTTGTTTAVDFGDAVAFVTAVVTTTSGTLATLSAQLQASLDGVNWFNVGTALSGTTTVQAASSSTVTAPFWRMNIATLTFTGTGTITVYIAGNQ